ncbi:MAG: 30S ribosomal protein S9 [Candidatus Pacearchaeota archaeon]
MAIKEKTLIVSGKRKTSVAKARVVPGNGKIFVNNILYNNLPRIHKLSIEEPMRIAKKTLKNFDFNIDIKISGGGRESQIEAARLALAKALVEKSKSQQLRKAFLEYDKHLLVADVRRKEAYKPGDSKARAKRQTSYR